jgi:hypothetical protein
MTDPDRWDELLDLVEEQLRVVIVECDPIVTIETDAEFISDGRALFGELSKLTDSPMTARRVRLAMERVGASTVPSFHLRSGPALSVIPGGAAPAERPSARYIDDEPEAG